MSENYWWNDDVNTDNITLNNSLVPSYMINYNLTTNQYLRLEKSLQNADNFLVNWLKKQDVSIRIEPKKDPALLFYKYVRDENWDAAGILIAQSRLELKKTNFYDPFRMHYDGYLTPTRMDSTKPFMSAQKFLKLGKTLKQKATQKGSAKDYMNYGMYLYSTSFHGHNSISDDGSLGYLNSDSYHRAFYYKVNSFKTPVYYNYYYKKYSLEPTAETMDYYQCTKAEQWFKKAYTKLTDTEEQAKCCFMLAKCVQKQCPMPEFMKNEYGYDEEKMINYLGVDYDIYLYKSKTNPYLQEMARKYNSTKTYQEAKLGCSYLAYVLY
jgi:hypothetical protein